MAGNAARLLFLAKAVDDVGQVALGHRVHDIRCRRPGGAHAHVQRAILHEGKAALAFIDLKARHADIQHHAVHRIVPGIDNQGVHFAKPAE